MRFIIFSIIFNSNLHLFIYPANRQESQKVLAQMFIGKLSNGDDGTHVELTEMQIAIFN